MYLKKNNVSQQKLNKTTKPNRPKTKFCTSVKINKTSKASKNLSLVTRFCKAKARPLCQEKKYVLMSLCLKNNEQSE